MTNKILNFELDKSLQCSTWNLRPLPPLLLSYAAVDALVLFPLFDFLTSQENNDEFLQTVLAKSNQLYKKMKVAKVIVEVTIDVE